MAKEEKKNRKNIETMPEAANSGQERRAVQRTQRNKKPQQRGRHVKDGKNGKPKIKNRKARLIIGGVIVLLVVVLVVVVLNLRIGPGLDGDIGTPNYLSGKTMNILVCGVDTDPDREGLEMALMTDVIMVVNLDLESGKVTILQIPRDLYVGQDLVQYGKINGLYYFGVKGENKTGGVNALARTINDQFQLPIDNYVLITMDGFREVIDRLGGVDVTLDQPMDFGGDLPLDVGTHTLTGAQAELFVRYRGYDTADIGRLSMQRYVLEGLMEKLLNTSSVDLASIVYSNFDHIDTDFSVNQVLQLAGTVQGLSKEDIRFVRVPGEPVTRYGLYGVDVFSVHKLELAEYLNLYMRPYQDAVPETGLNVIEIQKTIQWVDDDVTIMGEHPEGDGDESDGESDGQAESTP